MKYYTVGLFFRRNSSLSMTKRFIIAIVSRPSFVRTTAVWSELKLSIRPKYPLLYLPAGFTSTRSPIFAVSVLDLRFAPFRLVFLSWFCHRFDFGSNSMPGQI